MKCTVGFMNVYCEDIPPKRQHRVDETPSPEVECEARHHVLGDHLSKTIETFRGMIDDAKRVAGLR